MVQALWNLTERFAPFFLLEEISIANLTQKYILNIP